MKLATDNPHLFNNFELTEVMYYKNFKKIKGLGLHILIAEFLRDYGVYSGGCTWLCDLDGKQREEDKVIAVSIKIGEFPIENELVLQQLYGWTNSKVHIMLSGENSYGDFLYDLTNHSCVFQGEHFDTLSDLLETIKEVPAETTEYTLAV